MLASLCSLLAVVTIWLAVFGLGRPLVRSLALGQSDLLSGISWSLGLGLLASGWMFWTLALVGWLTPLAGGLLTLACSFWGLGELVTLFFAWRGAKRAVVIRSVRYDPPSLVLVALAILVALAGLISALAPPVSSEALTHTLEAAKTVLLAHGADPLAERPAGPRLVEMLYVWALALDGPVAANLAQWSLGILWALATTLAARPLVGRRFAPVAGALVLLAPGVQYQLSAPLGDLALGLYATLALTAAWKAIVEWEHPRWYLVAGLMLGAMAGVSLVAVLFALALGSGWLWFCWRQPQRRPQLTEGAGLAALAFLGSAALWLVDAVKHGAATIVVEPANFEHLGILSMILLPGLLWARRLRGLSLVLAVGGVYAALALVVGPQLRWWAPLVPTLALATTWVWMELEGLPTIARNSARFAALALACTTALVSWPIATDRAAVAFGVERPQDFLLRHQPSYAAAITANKLLHPDARLLSQDPQAFYFGCTVTDEHAYRQQSDYLAQLKWPRELSERLRADGFSYFLMVEPVAKPANERQQALTRLVDAQLADPKNEVLLKLSDYESIASDRQVCRYRLFMVR